MRKLIANMLVRVAHKLYDPTWFQTIELDDTVILVEASEYGGGISMVFGGADWGDHDSLDAALDWLCPDFIEDCECRL